MPHEKTKKCWLFAGGALGMWALSLCQTAQAETALERKVLNAAPPHLAAPAGKEVLVHYATLKGAVDGIAENAQRVQQLKNAVPECINLRQALGQAVKPPTEWPTYLQGLTESTYVTARYAITYFSGWAYTGLNAECGLVDSGDKRLTAVLRSRSGRCEIDVVNKTANGQCSLAAHQAAPPAPRAASPGGAQRAVQNIACHQLEIVGSTHCMASGGTFVPAYPLALERHSAHGIRVTASQAQLDLRVSETVFAPHLQPGFTVRQSNKP